MAESSDAPRRERGHFKTISYSGRGRRYPIHPPVVTTRTHERASMPIETAGIRAYPKDKLKPGSLTLEGSRKEEAKGRHRTVWWSFRLRDPGRR